MLRQITSLTKRELKHWYRVKIQVFMTIIQPVVWLGLFGQAFNIGQLFNVPGMPPGVFEEAFSGAPNYFSFMAIGMLAVNVLFTCMFSGMSIVWDRRFGFLNKLKVSPIPRGVIPVSRMMATVIRAMIQVVIVFAIAIAFNFVPGLTGLSLKEGFGLAEIAGSFAMLFLLALGFAALFTTIALAVENQETLFGVINLINLPLMFASAALFPTTLMPAWLRTIANYNPLTLAADGLRQLAFVDPSPVHSLMWDFIGLVLFAIALLAISIGMSRKLLSNR
ncbi:MAG: ABC transporter permease [Methanomassiliicoccus sp.]|nr:ABC transporter permease [Methanomassiliicoccus sp.]